ncbi:hypothetical protein PRIPAC_84998 [Pristionchus pacificus]|uniref:Uncharacterized protein n=1 Tax=Pristionchus pacificus TaxID=54126 RepID=A0A2A6BNM0_PRIPA|nr:hypothetical protein PRIPAC_84998 [Pristionchus pacificus]|eukprot:PDM67499.1 hypothetical protein PRIPAC_48916 [Pristionchus pacificus]
MICRRRRRRKGEEREEERERKKEGRKEEEGKEAAWEAKGREVSIEIGGVDYGHGMRSGLGGRSVGKKKETRRNGRRGRDK